MPNTVLDYNLMMLVEKGLLILESDGWVVPGAKSQQQVDRMVTIVGNISADTPTPAWSTEDVNTVEDVRRFLEGDSVEVSAELVSNIRDQGTQQTNRLDWHPWGLGKG